MSSTVRISGPLFDGAPGSLVDQAVQNIVKAVGEQGQQILTSPFPTGVPVKTGNYRRNINLTVQGARAQLDDSGVIYGPWLEGTGSRNATTRFKGYATFRRTTQTLQGQVGDIAKAEAEKLVAQLGGGL